MRRGRRVDQDLPDPRTGDPTGDFLELSYEEWQQVIDTNLSGAFLCAQRAARRMVEAGNGGRIVNITSVHEHVSRTGASAYCSSKAGLGLLTKVMAMELAEHGILINALGPGEIPTPMTGAEDEDPTTIVCPNLPLGRPGRARDRRLVRLPRFREGLPRNGRLVRRRRRPYADGGGVVELEDELTRAAFELVVFVAEVSGKALVEDPETVGEG
jgi:NAD(P)-dependent dehydrogenase (short-subunit alcohol dehydrogenase family)